MKYNNLGLVYDLPSNHGQIDCGGVEQFTNAQFGGILIPDNQISQLAWLQRPLYVFLMLYVHGFASMGAQRFFEGQRMLNGDSVLIIDQTVFDLNKVIKLEM